MNFSIHLPDPLLQRLDSYARSQEASRSGIIREAVQEYLARHSLQAWPADLEKWMQAGKQAGTEATPDFAAVRSEMNRSMRRRVAPRRRA